MKFLNNKNPEIYLSEITQYVTDLERVTQLRNKCHDPDERGSYTNIIHCMQEVMVFMNSISESDRKRSAKLEQIPDAQPEPVAK